MILDLYRYRTYIFINAMRDVRHRYSGTGLGVFWNILLPLAQIAIFSFVFSTIMPQKIHAGDSRAIFVIYLCSGLLPWAAFQEAVVRGTGSFIENATYLKKLDIPEQVFVAQSVLSAVFTLGISLLLLLVLSLCCGLQPHINWILLLPVCLLWQAVGFGLGLMLGTLNVFLRDIGQMVPVVFQLWLWSVPIVYSHQMLPGWYQQILLWNHQAAFLVSIRQILLENQLPPVSLWLAMVLWTLATIALGGLVLHLLRKEIRDVI